MQLGWNASMRILDAKVIVDASGEALELALKESVYLIKPNVREFKELADGGINEEAQIRSAAISLVENGWSEVVMSSGDMKGGADDGV